MDIQTVTDFFMWCSIINCGFLILGSIFLWVRPEFVYKIQGNFVPLSREQLEIFFYGFIGLFKILVLIFNVVPFIALKIIV